MTARYVAVLADGADIPFLNLGVAVFPGYDPLVVVIHILFPISKTKKGPVYILPNSRQANAVCPYKFDGILVVSCRRVYECEPSFL